MGIPIFCFEPADSWTTSTHSHNLRFGNFLSQISADEGDFGTVHPATEAYGQEVANEAGEINKMILLWTSQLNHKKKCLSTWKQTKSKTWFVNSDFFASVH